MGFNAAFKGLTMLYPEYFLGERQPVRRPASLTKFMCQPSLNLGVSTSWNHHGLSRPVMGYFTFFCPFHYVGVELGFCIRGTTHAEGVGVKYWYLKKRDGQKTIDNTQFNDLYSS